MKHPPFDIEPLVEALREDRPSAEERARVRQRLAAAGIFAGASGSGLGVSSAASASTELTASTATTTGAVSTTVASAGAAKVGLVSTVLALPAMAKVASVVGIAVAGAALSSQTIEVHTPQKSPATVVESPTHAAPQARRAVMRETVVDQDAERSATQPTLQEDAPPTHVDTSAASPLGARAPRTQKRIFAAPLAPTGQKPQTFSMPQGSTESASTLAAEAMLLEQALAALHRGDVSQAAELLEAHRLQFPAGALSVERERAQHQLRKIQNTPTHELNMEDTNHD